MKPSLHFLPLAAATAILAGCPDTGIICNPPDTLCGPTCANLNIDPANCGGCGLACATGFTCTNQPADGGTGGTGVCICEPSLGLSTCGQACVDVRTNPNNCGSCGVACASNQLCQSGMCTGSCSPGNTACGQSCTDVTSDPQNCGGCSGDGGSICAQGTDCIDGGCVPGLEVTCFNSGQLYAVNPQAEIVGGMTSSPPYSPIALAFYGPNESLVADEQTNQLFAFLTTPEGSLMLSGTFNLGMGAGPNSVVVQGHVAYVVDSSSHSLSVVNLADAGIANIVIPLPNSYPQYVAISPDGTEAYVTLQGNTEDSGNSDPDGNQIASINLEDGGVTFTAVPYDLDAGYEPRPQGIALVNGQLFVALANLALYTPAVPSTIDVFAPAGFGDGGFGGGLSLVRQNIALGDDCLNAGDVFPLNGTLFVACGPVYNADFTSVAQPGALAGININTLFEAFPPAPFSCAADGGTCHAGGALRMAYAAGKLFIGDSIDGRLFTADPSTGTILRGPNNAILVCPVGDGGANFISDVAAP